MTTTRRRCCFALLLTGLIGLANPAPSFGFVRGDANADDSVSIADAVFLLNALFVPNTPPLTCEDAGDVNDDGALTIADAVYLLSALFVPGANAIPAPYPNTGADPTPDALANCGPTTLAFQNISNGDASGHALGIQTVIYTAGTWNTFWTTHSTAPVPAVDFSTEMVVVVLTISPNLGQSIEITEIVDGNGDLTIHYTQLLPGVYFPMVTQPHHVVRAPRSQATNVTFVPTIIALP